MTDAETKMAKCPVAPHGWPNPLLPEYDQLPEGRPLTQVTMPSGSKAWLVAQHDQIQRLLADNRFSVEPHPTFPIRFPAPQELLDMIARDAKNLLVTMDPPRHTRVRQMALPDFTIKAAEKLRPRMQDLIDYYLDKMEAEGAPADLVQALALPFPAQVICELAGIPENDREIFTRNAAIMVGTRHSYTMEQKLAANEELMKYFAALVTEKQSNPTDDMLGNFIARAGKTDEFDHHGLTLMTKMLLLAGYEFIVNRIALGIQALVENPEQLAALRADMPGLMPKTVDEVLRYYSLVDEIIARVALEDVEIDGVTIKAGEGILVLKGLADRDPAKYPNPDVFDIHRDSRDHLAFGYGVHQCLGQHVARLMLEMSLTSLVERFPGLRLVESDEPIELIDGLPPVHKLTIGW
ncbi:cytochrome P450 [Streptomyces capillispiralis]|uniref:Cytochrome P450 n=1 Tax=Streptomyces capillispiralis TaxID=68182 RepID=A0A561TLC6_9ACTN|nr:cytochrome P450 [Streptomyces capillispiralis]TWF87928.1 cytochrome P450 [Streptomyces capillispiralis]GHH94980.1 cytochrome P450 [Streptomyces capillispiralis]